jgi:hypothetical protein
MPLVYTPLGTTPHQVDDFQEGCERSVKGALHFMPESTKVITDNELTQIKATHPDFAARLVILNAAMQPEKVAVAPAKPLTSRQKKLDAPPPKTVAPKATGVIILPPTPTPTPVAEAAKPSSEIKREDVGEGSKKFKK